MAGLHRGLFGWGQPVNPLWLAIFALLQLLRVWILATLGPRWTTRIIVLDEPLVRRGPFRFLRHPNHTLVVAEITVAPQVLGLVWVAVLFSILNALADDPAADRERRSLRALNLTGAGRRRRRSAARSRPAGVRCWRGGG